jgi:hypothetical protein
MYNCKDILKPTREFSAFSIAGYRYCTNPWIRGVRTGPFLDVKPTGERVGAQLLCRLIQIGDRLTDSH